MKQMSRILRKITSLKWYYQLTIALTSIVVLALLVKFLIWIIPIILGVLVLIFIFTDGEIYSEIWELYKKSKQLPSNPLYSNFYHWLTEAGVIELPIATLQFTQGVEFPDIAQGIFYVHLEKSVSEQELANFEMKVRQTVKTMSNGTVDCVLSIARHDPFLAIKIRLVSTSEMLVQNQHTEEDF
ncbi:TPA: hypothetical protein U1629_001777 [Streptococcus suis]|nr:hypothetical protein [Streptococcus suis]NQO22359.1 hypothetical protein [Streptococcus suis]NQP15679.1 hypothetical protein [Streptococcus suis]HEM5122093.1 hypothetical protein [Streptococcus suis]HEM5176232.1 hypothetical protein [Streptococcus suis]